MNKELEAKFFIQDKDSFRSKLKDLGAKLIKSEFLMRRKTFDSDKLDLQENEYKWLRVRDEGDKITMNIKHLWYENRIDNVDELEIEVSDFDEASKMIVEMGWTETNYQENYREKWEYMNSEITIDTWPGLEPYTEIEGPSEEEVRQIASELGFKWEDAIFGTVEYAYIRQLNTPLNFLREIKVLRFENADEVLKEYIGRGGKL
jgi:adenylate cyclase class 2